MPDHTPLHKEANVDKKIRDLARKRALEAKIKAATEAAKKKEKEKKNAPVGITVVPYKPPSVTKD